jgi:hypothetical protein
MHMIPKRVYQPLDRREFFGAALVLGRLTSAVAAEPDSLPHDGKAVWDLDKAHREKTATRERVWLNGLWRWQPATDTSNSVPTDQWGYFKVPGQLTKPFQLGWT